MSSICIIQARILSAKKRVFLAALYIGHTEKELVNRIFHEKGDCSSFHGHARLVN